MASAAKTTEASDLDTKARRSVKGAIKASFWGAITLDTKHVFVSKKAADISSAILEAGLSPTGKSEPK